MITICINQTVLQYDESACRYTVMKQGASWEWAEGSPPSLECEGETLQFQDAADISCTAVETGVGKGIRCRYKGFPFRGYIVPYEFETYVWIETSTEDLFFEWIPICEVGLDVKKVCWPGAVSFEKHSDNWYTLLNWQQGLLIPNTWETELPEILFGGFFGTAGGYMPWFSQIKERDGYIAICTTPWNAGYSAAHPSNGPFTHVSPWFEPSLGKMDYRRILRYTFLHDCDYNDMCKVYRSYVREQGKLRTLDEKAARVPAVKELIGRSFLHTGVKTCVREDSDFFDPENPKKNNSLVTFANLEKAIRKFHEAGAEKLYLHLDGWAQPGYDNQHPDYLPACKEAGGWKGMRSLVDTIHGFGDLIGVHDQYRDYYLAAPSYDEDFACRLVDGSVPGHRKWAGGPQAFLCGTQAPFYVKRNYGELKKHGIRLDCAYLDVFTCNEGDECGNPRHWMTRRDCLEARALCFEFLMSQGILPSSEEVSDWSIPSLVFCHYAPYDFMLREPGSPKYGIPIPLFNLVYHDCVIEPWMMDQADGAGDYMLYALLNGGAPYLLRDGAYPHYDGFFGNTVQGDIRKDIERCSIVAKLHERVAMCEMIRHEMEGKRGELQRTFFSDGTVVTVDFEKQAYEINPIKGGN